MPRYFVHTFGPQITYDREGVELPDTDALRDLLHRALSDMLKDDARTGLVQLWADACDEAGERVMTGKASILIADATPKIGK